MNYLLIIFVLLFESVSIFSVHPENRATVQSEGKALASIDPQPSFQEGQEKRIVITYFDPFLKTEKMLFAPREAIYGESWIWAFFAKEAPHIEATKKLQVLDFSITKN